MRNSGLVLGHNISGLSNSEKMQAIQHYAPAAFATAPAPHVSERYSFMSTMEILDNLTRLGWNISHVHASKRSEFGQHTIRLDHPDLAVRNFNGDALQPQCILTNSHDGTQRANLNIGLFRLVCTNGLVVGEKGAYDAIKVKHIGMSQNEFIDLTNEFANKFDKVYPVIGEMQNMFLTAEQRVALALMALALRNPDKYLSEDKQTVNIDYINRAHDMNSILSPVRSQDAEPTLWNTFNTLEEKMVNGNFHTRRLRGVKRTVQPKPILEAKRNIEFHSKFWIGATEMLEMQPQLLMD